MNLRKCVTLVIVLVHAISIRTTLAQQFDLDGFAVIQMVSDRVHNETEISLHVLHSFPALTSYKINDKLTTTKNNIWLRCPIHNLQEATLTINNIDHHLLLIPGDTVSISLKHLEKTTSLEFDGKSKQIQEYYHAKTKKFPISIQQLMLESGMSAKNLKIFKHRADSLILIEQTNWNDYKKKNRELPSWFVRYETDAINYGNAYIRSYIVTYQNVVQLKNSEIPEDYFTFLDTTPLRNEVAMYDIQYLNFLHAYFDYKAKAGTNDFNQQAQFDLAKTLLGEKIGNFYTVFTISSWLATNPNQVKNYLKLISLPESYQPLVDVLITRASANNEKLKSGDPAPNFYLDDVRDSLISLTDFKDHIIYLSFWFPGCKGCVMEFPFETELAEKFKNKPVKIISICTHTTKEKWLSTIKKYNLKATNLFANSHWGKILEEKYIVDVYPHYVLIGADGGVIENYAQRPSQIGERIEKELANLKKP